MTTAYCPTCRTTFATDANPPYAVIHRLDGQHLHAITREPIETDQPATTEEPLP